MTSDARQKCRNLRYAIMYNVIWANQKTEFSAYHWIHALAMSDITSFPAILSDVISSSVDTLILISYANMSPLKAWHVTLIFISVSVIALQAADILVLVVPFLDALF